MTRLLESIAGVAVAHRQHEKAEPDGQHDDVHHLNAPDGARTVDTMRQRLTGRRHCHVSNCVTTVWPANRARCATRRVGFRDVGDRVFIKIPYKSGIGERLSAAEAPGSQPYAYRESHSSACFTYGIPMGEVRAPSRFHMPTCPFC